MNQDLKEAIKLYATRTHKELNNYLLDKSKDNLIAIFNDLLTTYFNDKNSSTMREYITTAICGYEHSESKIGYNGFRQVTINGKSKILECEVKPKNIDSNEIRKWKNGERKSKPAVLNAGGNFTDYTWDRFDKDLQNNPNMLISGFVDGKLMYIFEFPFNINPFTERLKLQLEKKFPNRVRKENDFLRSASFTYQDFISDKSNTLKFILSKNDLEKYKEFFEGNFFNLLLSMV